MPYDSRLDKFIDYFDLTVLAPYRAEPDKYEISTDHFEGELDITDQFLKRLSDDEYLKERVSVRFGYRTLENGELTIAAFLPDFNNCGEAHIDRWKAFRVQDAEWMDYDDDPRFSSWVKRYLEGSWDVENGPGFRLVRQIERLNGLSMQAVGCKLFAVDNPIADFPDAQNTHRYEDAHGELYKVLLDGLNRDCIERLAARVGRPMNLKSDRTLNALVKVFPTLEGNAKFQGPLNNVSEQRRRSSHKTRPPAQPMKAFEQFGTDLEGCVEALEVLCRTLEQELGMDADYSAKRQRAVEMLPTIEESPNAAAIVGTLNRLVGRTVAKIEFGDRKHIDGVHESEALILHLDDGSLISIETGSNAQNVLGTERSSEFHVRFHVHRVPPEKP